VAKASLAGALTYGIALSSGTAAVPALHPAMLGLLALLLAGGTAWARRRV
jgi:hypothetical protein